MPREPEGSVRSCAERVARAEWALAIGLSALPQRLADAAETVGILDPRDFPPDLRLPFVRIHEAITAEGSFEDSIRAMTADTAQGIARQIAELAAEVARRNAIETAKAPTKRRKS